MIERLVDGRVRDWLIVFGAHDVARKIAEAVTIEDLAAQSGSLRRGGRGSAGAELVAERTQACVNPYRTCGSGRNARVCRGGKAIEQMRGHDGAAPTRLTENAVSLWHRILPQCGSIRFDAYRQIAIVWTIGCKCPFIKL